MCARVCVCPGIMLITEICFSNFTSRSLVDFDVQQGKEDCFGFFLHLKEITQIVLF